MWLIIDDVRTLGCDVVARTAKDGMDILSRMSDQFECLCIDHDLGEGKKGKSGYDVLKWALPKGYVPDHVQIVSKNPVGAQNIRNILTDYGYRSTDRINYFRKDKRDGDNIRR